MRANHHGLDPAFLFAFGPSCGDTSRELNMTKILVSFIASIPLLVIAMFLDMRAGGDDLKAAAKSDQAARPVAYRGGRIHTAAGAPIENGVLIVDKG
jgi:hypothetical protein